MFVCGELSSPNVHIGFTRRFCGRISWARWLFLPPRPSSTGSNGPACLTGAGGGFGETSRANRTLFMDPQLNPFAVLSSIVAPAMLTSATSILAMSTSNRLARAVDRARELSKQLEAVGGLDSPEAVRRLSELTNAERRSLMLLRSLQGFYVALGCFASAALASLFGAMLFTLTGSAVVRVFAGIGIAAALIAVGALVYGCSVLVRETHLAVKVLRDRATDIRARAAKRT
jgi:hypothetical protein